VLINYDYEQETSMYNMQLMCMFNNQTVSLSIVYMYSKEKLTVLLEYFQCMCIFQQGPVHQTIDFSYPSNTEEPLYKSIAPLH